MSRDGRTGTGHRAYRRNQKRLRRQRNPCAGCGQPIDYDLPAGNPQSFTADHIEPVHDRPDLALRFSNLQAMHMACNSSKGKGPREPQNPTSEEW